MLWILRETWVERLEVRAAASTAVPWEPAAYPCHSVSPTLYTCANPFCPPRPEALGQCLLSGAELSAQDPQKPLHLLHTTHLPVHVCRLSICPCMSADFPVPWPCLLYLVFIFSATALCMISGLNSRPSQIVPAKSCAVVSGL